jgi:hypothetical protein
MMLLRVLLALAAAGCGRPADPASRPAIGAESGERVTVEVLNGSRRPGLARRATLALRAAGLDVLSYGTADTQVDTTLVLVRRGRESQGARVQRALGVGAVRVAIDTLRRVDVSVLLGPDWRPPPGLRP